MSLIKKPILIKNSYKYKNIDIDILNHEYVIHIPGDGNCLYTSIIVSILYNCKKHKSFQLIKYLLVQIINLLRNDMNYYDSFLINKFIDINNKYYNNNNYINNILQFFNNNKLYKIYNKIYYYLNSIEYDDDDIIDNILNNNTYIISFIIALRFIIYKYYIDNIEKEMFMVDDLPFFLLYGEYGQEIDIYIISHMLKININYNIILNDNILKICKSKYNKIYTCNLIYENKHYDLLL